MNASFPPIVPVSVSRNSHFDQIGGVEIITALVERFYHYMVSLPEAQSILEMHPTDLTGVKHVLVLFLVEWMGGEKQYSAQRGHPRLRMKHMNFPIGAAERDAWIMCMRMALDDMVPDATLRTQLEQAFFKTADFIRNEQGNHHDHHHR